MFISKLELKNFKRFTDLTIDLSDTKTPPKLVLMIGANGSGKSSVFDAFELVSGSSKDEKYDRLLETSSDAEYYRKNDDVASVNIVFSNNSEVTYGIGATPQIIKTDFFYGRSALRQLPRLTRLRPGSGTNLLADGDRPRYYIDFDQRFENDIDGIISKLLKDVFSETDWDTRELRDRYLNPINKALQNIFGQDAATALSLRTLIPPGENQVADIRFTKGNSDIHYDLLSSGEKEIVNILFNLFFRKEIYQDTIYFIDELDVHLNTALQYNLLKEIIENWVPNNCQLWTASHSLGFIQYAKESEHAVILDFDQYDFDLPQIITPQIKDTLEVYEIAVPTEMLSSLFKDRQLIFCENQNDKYYQAIGLENKLFIGVKDKNEVYYRTKHSPSLFGLMDRDYMTDDEIAQIRQKVPNLFILQYYAFENYEYHPENLRELIPDFNIEEYKAELTRLKKEQFNRILLGLKQARSYKILKDEQIEDKDAPEAIATALESDDFETFYAYFNMKDINGQYRAKYNLSDQRLTQTKWFKNAISKIFQA